LLLSGKEREEGEREVGKYGVCERKKRDKK
jgi:hypothetical protein